MSSNVSQARNPASGAVRLPLLNFTAKDMISGTSYLARLAMKIPLHSKNYVVKFTRHVKVVTDTSLLRAL